jgi:hypothetical protein
MSRFIYIQMTLSVFITITILNILSLIFLYAIHRNTNHVIRSHSRIIDGENSSLVETNSVRFIKILHGISVLALIVASYIIFSHPW